MNFHLFLYIRNGIYLSTTGLHLLQHKNHLLDAYVRVESESLVYILSWPVSLFRRIDMGVGIKYVTKFTYNSILPGALHVGYQVFAHCLLQIGTI